MDHGGGGGGGGGEGGVTKNAYIPTLYSTSLLINLIHFMISHRMLSSGDWKILTSCHNNKFVNLETV